MKLTAQTTAKDLMTPFKVSNKKIGKNRDLARVWIEGTQLEAAGFSKGDTYNVTYTNNSLIIVWDVNGKSKTAGRIKNGKPVPIIDICNKQLTEFVQGQNACEIEFYLGCVIVRVQ